MTTLMRGKRGLIMGVANDMSLAWGIARTLHQAGAKMAFTYQGEALKKRVLPLAEGLGDPLCIPCDVAQEGNIENVFDILKKEWGEIDFVLHSLAYADKHTLKGRYVDTSKEAFLQSLDISCFSFARIAQQAEKLMPNGGALLTMTYYGAEKVMPHYNLMGVSKAALEASVRYLAVDLGLSRIRVNALSAGPVKTLAASGIGDFHHILKWNQYNSPLRCNITLDDVGGAGLYLLSSLSSGVTGEVHHVDNGYHVIGMKCVDAPDITTV